MKKKIPIPFLLLSLNTLRLTGSKETTCQTTNSATQNFYWLIPPSGTIPQFFFSDQPAELIQLKDLLVDNIPKQYHALLSGRSFRAGELNGQWFYAGANLPADFKKNLSNSSKGDVLVSVK